jgi:hypothetical protein
MSIEEKAIKKSYSFLYYKGDNIIVDDDAIFINKSNNKILQVTDQIFYYAEPVFGVQLFVK